MKSIKSSLHLIFVVGVLFTLNIHFLSAQETTEVAVDSTAIKQETIALANISIKSGEGFITTKRIAESLIPDNQLHQLQYNSDSILFRIDSLISVDAKIDVSSTNVRFLDNKLMFWYDQESEVEMLKSSLSEIVQELDEIKYELAACRT